MSESEVFESEMDYFSKSKDPIAWKIFIYIVNRKQGGNFKITYDDWYDAVMFFKRNKLSSATYKDSMSWPFWWAVLAKARILKTKPGQEITKSRTLEIYNGKQNYAYLRTISKINSFKYLKSKYESKLEEAVDETVTKFATKKAK